MMYLFAASLLAIVVLAPQFKFLTSRRKLSKRTWEDLLSSVEEVNLEEIREIADVFLNPTKDQLRLEPPTMWRMLGGLKGLQKMHRNAEIMLQLCVYAERWDAEAPVVSEMVRLDAINFNKALRRVELAAVLGFGHLRGHFAIMEIAAHYELIRRRLLGQYEKSHIARLAVLQAQLGA